MWKRFVRAIKALFGKAVSSIEDPKLSEHLAQHQIGLEVSLTSNVQTSMVPDYVSHPLKQFLQAGVKATINTDDPGISAIDLPHEYNIAAPEAGLSAQEVQQAQRNALDIAFLSKEEKAALHPK